MGCCPPSGAVTSKWSYDQCHQRRGHRRSAGNAAADGGPARIPRKPGPPRRRVPAWRRNRKGNRGVVAKLIVQNGTLRVGDIVVCGRCPRARQSHVRHAQTNRKTSPAAGPSMPVNVTGLDIAPEAGDAFYVLDDISTAREIAEQRANTVPFPIALGPFGPRVVRRIPAAVGGGPPDAGRTKSPR